jgi:hypothetical protein
VGEDIVDVRVPPECRNQLPYKLISIGFAAPIEEENGVVGRVWRFIDGQLGPCQALCATPAVHILAKPARLSVKDNCGSWIELVQVKRHHESFRDARAIYGPRHDKMYL